MNNNNNNLKKKMQLTELMPQPFGPHCKYTEQYHTSHVFLQDLLKEKLSTELEVLLQFLQKDGYSISQKKKKKKVQSPFRK